MAPRKKANKNAPQAAVPEVPLEAAPEPAAESVNGGNDVAGYPDNQQNEFLTTQAIYPDGFERIRGRKDAWSVSSVLPLHFNH